MLRAIASVFACALVLASCADSGSPTAPYTPTAPVSRLRAVGTARVAGAVEVLVDGRQLIGSLAHGQATAYLGVDSGLHRVQVRVAGSLVAGADTLVRFAGYTDYTLLPVGPADSLDPLIVADTGAIPAPGTAKIRVIHSASLAPEVDVYLTQPDYPLEFIWLFPFNFGTVSNYQQSTPGDYRVRVMRKSDGAVLLDTGPITQSAGQVRTIVVLDDGRGGLEAVILRDRG